MTAAALGRALLAATVMVVVGLAAAAGASAAVTLAELGRFDQPVHVAAPAGDASRVFVVQRGGKVTVVRDGVSSTFLDITSRVRSTGGEQGLLSLAFAPDYATSGTFYVYYTAPPPAARI